MLRFADRWVNASMTKFADPQPSALRLMLIVIGNLPWPFLDQGWLVAGGLSASIGGRRSLVRAPRLIHVSFRAHPGL